MRRLWDTVCLAVSIWLDGADWDSAWEFSKCIVYGYIDGSKEDKR